MPGRSTHRSRYPCRRIKAGDVAHADQLLAMNSPFLDHAAWPRLLRGRAALGLVAPFVGR